MWNRARKIRFFDRAEVRYASFGDIFIMKLIANREGDTSDCASLISAGLDFNEIYEEIQSQYRKASLDQNQKIWITYLEEGLGRLEDVHGMDIPVADKISELADEYRERLYQDLTDK